MKRYPDRSREAAPRPPIIIWWGGFVASGEKPLNRYAARERPGVKDDAARLAAAVLGVADGGAGYADHVGELFLLKLSEFTRDSQSVP
jgi:hypothetical protein